MAPSNGNETWFNAEDNSDFDTSNESYMSDDPDEACVPQREFTREEKAIFSRRFEPYFARKRMTSDDYWRGARVPYARTQWLKLTFDGQTKRCIERPAELNRLLELAKERFGVFRHILASGQFKPFVSFKADKLARFVHIQSSKDLQELYSLTAQENWTVHLRITFKRIGQDEGNLVPFNLSKQLIFPAEDQSQGQI